MSKPYFPDNFTTEINGVSLSVESDGQLLHCCDLRYLSNKLLNGQRLDRSEIGAAGAAISHLLALTKSAPAVTPTASADVERDAGGQS